MENNVDQPDLAYSSPSQPTSTPSPQKDASLFWKVLVGVLVLVVGALAFVIYSLYQSIQILTQLPSPTPPASIEPSANPTVPSQPQSSPTVPSASPISGSFVKRLFVPDSFFFSKNPFPREMRDLKDEQLVGLSCTGAYDYNYNDVNPSYLKFTNDTEPVALTDFQLLAFLKTNKDISSISKCVTDTNQTIIHYDIAAGGGGTGTKAYFGFINQNNQVTNLITIPNDGAPYFGCRSPYALTKNNIFYYGCGGGDGGMGQGSIYKINLSSKTFEKLILCRSIADGYDTTTTCE